jgi:hypothetical protein
MEPPAKRVCAYKDRWEQRAEAKERAEKEKEKGSQEKYEEAWKQELDKVREKEKEKDQGEKDQEKEKESEKEKGPLRGRATMHPAGSIKRAYIRPGTEGRLMGHRIVGSKVLFLGEERPSVQVLLDSIRDINDLVVETLEAQGQEM